MSRPERVLERAPGLLRERQGFNRVYSEATFGMRPASLRVGGCPSSSGISATGVGVSESSGSGTRGTGTSGCDASGSCVGVAEGMVEESGIVAKGGRRGLFRAVVGGVGWGGGKEKEKETEKDKPRPSIREVGKEGGKYGESGHRVGVSSVGTVACFPMRRGAVTGAPVDEDVMEDIGKGAETLGGGANGDGERDSEEAKVVGEKGPKGPERRRNGWRRTHGSRDRILRKLELVNVERAG